MVLLEFDRGQVVQALVRAYGVVVPTPCLDENVGFTAAAEPLQTETLVAQFAVERFVGSVLPRFSGIDDRGVMRFSVSHFRIAWLTNSGPLSERR